jgi:hypothetical protein
MIETIKGQKQILIRLSLIPLSLFLRKNLFILSSPIFLKKGHWYKHFFTPKKNIRTVVPKRIKRKSLYLKQKNQGALFSSKLVFEKNKSFVLHSFFSTLPIFFLDSNKNTFENPSRRIEIKTLCLSRSNFPNRKYYRWEVKQSQIQKKPLILSSKRAFSRRFLMQEHWNPNKRFITSRIKQKWQSCHFTNHEKVFLKAVWKRAEKQEILFRNRLNWANIFEEKWQDRNRKKYFQYQDIFPRSSRKFRLKERKKNNIGVRYSNFFLLFSFLKTRLQESKREHWKRRIPFSEILYIPRIRGKTFQKRTKRGGKRIKCLNLTRAERFSQNPSPIGLPRRNHPSLRFSRQQKESMFLFQERTRLFDKNVPIRSQLGRYLANGNYIREKAERMRREARWSSRNNRRRNSLVYIYHRPYRRIFPSRIKLGRRRHPYRSSYLRVIRNRVISISSIRLRKKWEERKYISIYNLQNRSTLNSSFSKGQKRSHHFQRSVRLNHSFPSALENTDLFYKNSSFFCKKKYWRRWKSPNLPLLAKARRKWLKIWNQRNPFLLGETRRAGSLYRNRLGRRNFSWWRLIRPILLDLQKLRKEEKLPWQYVTTFSQIPRKNLFYRTRENPFKKRIALEPIFSFFPFQLVSHQRTLSIGWIQEIQNTKINVSSDYIVWFKPDEWTFKLAPFTIFLLIRTKNILRKGFHSVQQDFVYALYQLIHRRGSIEIEPEWIEWLLNTLGLSQQSAGIRIYPAFEGKEYTLTRQIAGLKKEMPIVFNLLLYLRGWKRKVFFLRNQKAKNFLVEEETTKFWFGNSRPAPLLLVGAPGTGKTMLIRVLAGESETPVIYQCLASFSDVSKNFTSFGFGRTVASQAVQRGFQEARSRIPAILFLDEIDALEGTCNFLSPSSKGKNFTDLPFPEENKFRQKNPNSEDRILGLGQLLVEIDGGIKNEGLVLFRATNRPQKLDIALIRPGRFNQILSIPLPNKKKRRAILKFYLHRFPRDSFFSEFWTNPYNYSSKEKNWENWLSQTKGKSPAYLSTLRKLAVLNQRVQIHNRSFEQRFEVIWTRIEILNSSNFWKKFSTKKTKTEKKLRTQLLYFFELQYGERRNSYWNKKIIGRQWRDSFFYV